MVCRWSWRIESIEPTRNLFLKTVARVCSWRLKKQGNPSLRTGKNSTTDPHFLFKTVTRICSWRLKNRGNPPLRTGKNSTTYSHFYFQNKSSHLPLETEKTRKTEFESRLKQHGRLAIFADFAFFLKNTLFSNHRSFQNLIIFVVGGKTLKAKSGFCKYTTLWTPKAKKP